MQENFPYMFSAIIALAFSIAIGFLLVIHTYLLLTNMSTLEMGAIFKDNPFAKNNWRENVAQVFGYDWKSYLFPIEPKDRTSDGINHNLKPMVN